MFVCFIPWISPDTNICSPAERVWYYCEFYKTKKCFAKITTNRLHTHKNPTSKRILPSYQGSKLALVTTQKRCRYLQPCLNFNDRSFKKRKKKRATDYFIHRKTLENLVDSGKHKICYSLSFNVKPVFGVAIQVQKTKPNRTLNPGLYMVMTLNPWKPLHR